MMAQLEMMMLYLTSQNKGLILCMFVWGMHIQIVAILGGLWEVV